MSNDRSDKLTIAKEKEGGRNPQFEMNWLEALFNPHQLSINKSVSYEAQKAKGRDVPELQFTNASPRTLSLELWFDTYNTPEAEKKDVRKTYTDKLLTLTMFDSKLHRPPICELSWGKMGGFFRGVLEKFDLQLTMFTAEGTPVRASCKCTFKEWVSNPQDRENADPQSPDVAKAWVVRRGDTLSSIATLAYRNPRLWRPIARANGIDDPLDFDVALRPGRSLAIPRLSPREQRGEE